MSAPRFFIDEQVGEGSQAALGAADSRHAALVLRLHSGDELVVVSAGQAWRARFVSLHKRAATIDVIAPLAEGGTELPQPVTILQALPKGSKMDFVIEKTVELGAACVVPVQCARSHGAASDMKLERWRSIARSAAQQSRRLVVPRIEEPMPWEQAMQRFRYGTHLLVAHEAAKPKTLAQALDKDGAPLTLAVGPEGSLTPQELDLAREVGADIVALGPTILRTETAAVAMLAAVACYKRWW